MKSRYRISYSKNELMRYTSNLDVQKSWERSFRRAKMPIAYSQGFHPQPKIQLACPLPLGFLSEDEILDFVTNDEIEILEIHNKLAGKTPPGIEIKEIIQVDLDQPSLQVQTQATRYRFEFLEPIDTELLIQDCEKLLSQENILRERRGKSYNLRPLILDLSIDQNNSETILRTTLSAKEKATGRPE
jgi:radical SAM-linked protein